MARNGARTLLVCFNKGLADKVNSARDLPSALTVRTFHSLAGSFCQQAGITITEHSDSRRSTFYTEELPNAFLNAIDRRPDLRFDAIIVDEAQDFEETWWVPIQLLLRDAKTSAVYVFYDDNQNIFRRDSPFLNDLPSRFQLTRNLRNAASVFDTFSAYYNGSHYEAGNDLLGDVSFHPGINTQAALTSFIERLVTFEQIPTSDIVVLTCTSVEGSLFGLQAISETTISGEAVRVESVWRFKGQEAPVVVLTDLGSALTSREILYTALSRAQVRLCIVGFSGPLPVF
ncbi:MAG: ATP-binding domain-containing protein [Bryobacterales bacterium]|nr:ATP-binding domain-containing protein [Bryobacterales bacterium]